MYQKFWRCCAWRHFMRSIFQSSAQRRQGVRTNQIGRGDKTAGTLLVERLLGAATLSIVPVEAASIRWAGPPARRALCGRAGPVPLGCAVFSGRGAGLGGSWRAGIPAEKDTALVTGGVYAHSRNPAFLGFDLVYLGLLLWFFNWLHLAFALFAVLMLHLQILQEEAWLGETLWRCLPELPRPHPPVLGGKAESEGAAGFSIRRPFPVILLRWPRSGSSTGPKGRNTRPRTPGCTSSAWL